MITKGKGRPAYAEMIYKLRKQKRLTQKRFGELLALQFREDGKRLKIVRGTVAQWEAGLREPRLQVYIALSKFAPSRSFKTFFRKQSEIRIVRARQRATLKYLNKIVDQAVGGDQLAEHFLAEIWQIVERFFEPRGRTLGRKCGNQGQ